MRTQELIGQLQAVWIDGIERNAVVGWEFDSWRSSGTFLGSCEVWKRPFLDSGDNASSSAVMWASALGFLPTFPVCAR